MFLVAVDAGLGNLYPGIWVDDFDILEIVEDTAELYRS